MKNDTNLPHWLNYSQWRSPRWKCAIARSKMSMPMRIAVENGVVNPRHFLLDFGCGRSQDVEHLQRLNFPCAGFDPYWNYHLTLLQPSDVVSCIYVINVIECPIERMEVLQYCWSLCVRSLVVAVRCDGKGEGLTSIGTYQKYYTQVEFKDFIVGALGKVNITFPKSGIAFIHKSNKQLCLFSIPDRY